MDHDEGGRDVPVQPSHIAYHVREGAEKPYFNRIGSAFEHKDGKGFNILLDAMPVDGRVTLRSNEERLRAIREEREPRAGAADRDERSPDRGRTAGEGRGQARPSDQGSGRPANHRRDRDGERR